MMGVLCATAEKSGLLKKRTAVNLNASDYVGLPKNIDKQLPLVYCILFRTNTFFAKQNYISL